MTEEQLELKLKEYIRKMANGIDPRTNIECEPNSVLNDEMLLGH